jgi:hypothetical protein
LRFDVGTVFIGKTVPVDKLFMGDVDEAVVTGGLDRTIGKSITKSGRFISIRSFCFVSFSNSLKLNFFLSLN